MSSDSLLDRFHTPTPADRGRVLWVWNGSLSRANLLRQLREFQAAGASGAIIRAGSGLRTAYLGPDWLELINACADEANRLGMKLWVFDEERGPSGAAGGLATAEGGHARKFLRLKIADGNFEWPHRATFVKAFAARVDGLAFRECEPLEYKAPAPPDGRQVLLFTTGTYPAETIYNEHPPLDLLSREATARFINLTHERYRTRALTRLGTSIDGFLTDTPSPGTIMAANAALPEAEWTVPWTPGLWDEFQRAWGYDLRDHLPELFLFLEGCRFSRVKLNFASTIQRLLENHWLRPLREWCDAVRVRLVGCLRGSGTMLEQSAACPSPMRVAEFFDLPVLAGADVAALKPVASVARQMACRHVLTLTSLVEGASAIRGITDTVAGIEPASREGPAKRIFAERLDRVAVDAAARLQLLLSAGERVCDVLIIHPIETAWAQIHPGWTSNAETRAIEQQVCDVARWLGEAQIDFDFADESTLARRASVLQDRLGLGPASYRAVIVAGAKTLRGTTLELLRQMIVAGGTVVFAGEPPTHIDGRPSGAAQALSVDAHRIPVARADLLRIVAPDAPPLVLEMQAGHRDLLCQVRRAGERWIVALMNSSGRTPIDPLSVLIESTGALEEWHCESGDTTPVSSDVGETSQRWQTSLAPDQLRIFVVSPSPSPACVRVPPPCAAPAEELTLYRLESAEWQIQRDAWQPACDLVELDRSLRAELGQRQRDELRIQPWARQESFGSTMRVRRLTLRFHFRLATLPDESFDLVMESPSSCKLSLNGAAIRVPTHPKWHGDPSQLLVPLPTDALREGANELLVLVPFTDETDLEPIALLGRFTIVENESGPVLKPR